MVQTLRPAGGARQWLRDFKRSRRRINDRALAGVWEVATRIDMICSDLLRLAAAAADREEMDELARRRRVHSSFLLMAAASDTLEDCARHVAAWHHLHTSGDQRACDFIRHGPQLPDIIPLWLIRRARRAARAQRRKSRRTRAHTNGRATPQFADAAGGLGATLVFYRSYPPMLGSHGQTPRLKRMLSRKVLNTKLN